jgi:hypothetical protein
MASNESLVKVNSAQFSAARVAANNHQRSISWTTPPIVDNSRLIGLATPFSGS